MNVALIAFTAGMVTVAASFGFGVRVGQKMERNTTLQADLKHSNLVRVRIQKESVIEERVVTKWRDREKTIVVNAAEIKHEIPVFVRADCVLPSDFVVQLHAISRNTTVAALGLSKNSSEGADCRATLDALRRSYENHYLDAAQLNAVLEREFALEAGNANP